MKRFVLAITLACALSGTALAGHIPSTDVAAPTPPPETTQPGVIHSTDSTAPTAPVDMPTCGLSALLTLISLAF